MLAALAMAYGGAVLAALTGSPRAFLVLAVIAQATDVLIELRVTALRSVLRAAQFGLSNRTIIRDLALTVLLARAGGLDDRAYVLATLAVLSVPLFRYLFLGLRVPLLRRALPQVEVRNIDVACECDRIWIPTIVRSDPSARLTLLSLPVVIVATLGPIVHNYWPLMIVAVLTLAVLGVLILLELLILWQMSRRPSPSMHVEHVNQAVTALAPQVALYFSGSASSTYQAAMWLPVLERTNQRCLVVLRERVHLDQLPDCTVPVICIPSSVVLMTFRMPSLRIALYVANVGKNIHMLREPGLKHVFIGHGDSDKVASVNPFTRVHDEVWVAGQAARDRYAQARVGVRDDTIVEVGRPQLRDIAAAQSGPAHEPLTVLYAPTWEGWTYDPFHTSLVLMGPGLIRALLAADPPVRIIYKPHPLTGSVRADAAASHHEIVGLLSRAEPAAEVTAEVTDPVVLDHQVVEQPVVEQPVVEQPVVEQPVVDHLVVDEQGPSLYECFNDTDLLITDVSSVVSDFLASQKPYVVTNPADLAPEVLRKLYPSAGAAYLLGLGLRELDAILQQVRADDPMAEPRRELARYLLGPATADPMQRWNDAVDRLLARSYAERPADQPAADAPEPEAAE